jgi:hypothetical protein
MKKLLNTFICILLTSPLAAFDISLEGVKFGVLELDNINLEDSGSGTPNFVLSPSEVILNEGDVVQILDIGQRLGTTDYDYNIGFANFENINDASQYVIGSEGAYFVGPGKLRIRASQTMQVSNGYVRLSYAILRAGASTQSSYVTIPANPSGNFEVKLQTSTDLETWTPTTPGVFPYGNNAKFFRLVVE